MILSTHDFVFLDFRLLRNMVGSISPTEARTMGPRSDFVRRSSYYPETAAISRQP